MIITDRVDHLFIALLKFMEKKGTNYFKDNHGGEESYHP